MAKKENVKRNWYIVDAKDKIGPDVNHRFESPSRQAQTRIYTPC